MIGWLARHLPCLHGHGTCGRCGRPWCRVDEHTTPYSMTSGCFPLCEPCWAALTPEERLPYYETLIARWNAGDHPISPETADDIRCAVLAGR